MEFKKNKAYRIGHGMVWLNSVFTVSSGGVDYHTLYGNVVGWEDYGTMHRIWTNDNFEFREVTWEEYFETWLNIKVRRASLRLDKKLEEALK